MNIILHFLHSLMPFIKLFGAILVILLMESVGLQSVSMHYDAEKRAFVRG
jgi:hypothetical protein